MTPAELLEQCSWDLFWLPPYVTVVDRPELAYFTCSRGGAHLNTVVRVRAPAARLPALIAEVLAAHVHGCSRWLVHDPPAREPHDEPHDHIAPAPLARALARAGYARTHRHDVRMLRVAAFQGFAVGDVDVRAVASTDDVRACWAVADSAFDHGAPRDDDDAEIELAQCVAPGARNHRFIARDADGAPVSTGGMTAHHDLGVGLLWGGSTVPHARGRGAYTAVLAARIERARQLGLQWVGLYARTTTSSPIVTRRGFGKHGEMEYWERPGRPAGGAAAPEGLTESC